MSHPPSVFHGKRVLVTGHTGFKGAWLSEWLMALGADVWGFSLPPPTTPSLFEQLGLAKRLHHQVGDVRAQDAVRAAIEASNPDFVFHLAAQPLVRFSYEAPVETYATNVMGTVHVLEALRVRQKPCVAVMVTTDKCYDNKEWLYGYRENDPLGGHDPYSSSKGAAEIVIAAYRKSYFYRADSPVLVASARAGNVIGGGDWALDRIVPDCMRALAAGQPILVRNPVATRPWQHVLEPLGGYLALAAALAKTAGRPSGPGPLASGFNFGPALEANRSVKAVVEAILSYWPGTWTDASDPKAVHEATLLNLVTDKASHLLHWQPRWGFDESIRHTVEWYRDAQKSDPAAFTRSQIGAYATPTFLQLLQVTHA